MPGLLIESSFHPLEEPHGIAHGCLPRFQYPIHNPGDIMDGSLIYNIPQIIDGIHPVPSSVSHGMLNSSSALHLIASGHQADTKNDVARDYPCRGK